MVKIYHNPRCTKSREGLKLVEETTSDYILHKYLDDRLTYLELLEILKKLDMEPIQLVRKNEKIWKEEFRGKDLTDEQIINAMVAHPRLIERPIVVKDNKAVVGRPSSNIIDLLNS